MDKPALRAAARARRDAFAATSPPPIVADTRFHALLAPGAVVATYAPVGSETGPAPLELAARAAGCRLALPLVVDRATPLRFLLWDGEPLAPGPYGLRNPQERWPEVAPDLVLAPLLAFDEGLNRLGQGAGHYDRAFAAHPNVLRVGVAWSVQRIQALPVEPWDMPLHAIATETDWWTR